MIPLEFGVQLVTRREWGAAAATSWTPIKASYGSTGHWEGPEMGYPWDHSACATKVRGIQNFHMKVRGWVDIAYSAVACPHGYLFEGRGPGKRTAANGTNVGNNTAYAICYLGGVNDGFTDAGERAMLAGFNWLQREGASGPHRNGHRDWKSTQCPGDEIYSWIHNGQPIDGGPTPIPPEDDDMQPPLLVMAKPGQDPTGAWFVISAQGRTWVYDASTIGFDLFCGLLRWDPAANGGNGGPLAVDVMVIANRPILAGDDPWTSHKNESAGVDLDEIWKFRDLMLELLAAQQ